MPLPDASRLSSLDPMVLRDLGRRLRSIGVDSARVAEIAAIGASRDALLRLPIRKWHLRRMREPSAHALRMLMFGDPVTRDEAREALGELVDPLVASGFVVEETGGLVSPFFLGVADQVYVFADHLTHGGDAAMGLGETTIDLCRAARPTRRVSRVLDMGCGAGTAALVCAARCDRVIGVDVNPRATDLARLNQRLNDIDNAEFRVGDLFAPVAGETFDLVVSQPPFISRPEGVDAAVYAYGGERGDEFPLRMLRELPDHLSERGRAVLLVDWPVLSASSEPIESRVRAAVGDRANVLVLETPEGDVDDWSTGFAAAHHPTLGPGFEREVMVRREHFARLGVRALCMTAVVLERTTGAPWTSTVKARSLGAVSLTAEQLDQLVAARDLAADGPEALLGATLRIPAGTEFSRDGGHVVATLPDRSLVEPIAVNEQLFDLLRRVDQADCVRTAVDRHRRGDARAKERIDATRQALLLGLLERA
ncbi:MAG: methyltransferase [Myxococcales bacterium]|nr:methyltransferase [Myxococcales bacterium]